MNYFTVGVLAFIGGAFTAGGLDAVGILLLVSAGYVGGRIDERKSRRELTRGPGSGSPTSHNHGHKS